AEVGDADTVFEAALEAGADDVSSDDETHEIYCAAENLNAVALALTAKLGEPKSTKLIWKPQTTITLADEEQARQLMKLLDALDDNDDVQDVYGNYEVPEEIMAKLNA
ncbi:MAG TPA: YebC/PmpR family DNA-binding transcriptional regulator, partial [Sphingomonadales bacterium]